MKMHVMSLRVDDAFDRAVEFLRDYHAAPGGKRPGMGEVIRRAVYDYATRMAGSDNDTLAMERARLERALRIAEAERVGK